MSKLFGTDGIRARAGEYPLERDTIASIAAALVEVIGSRGSASTPRILIGMDTRESGEWIRDAFCSGAEQAGAKMISAGVITTPGVAHMTAKLDADAGVVISASHNPFDDNGIKVFLPTGKKLDDDSERAIERRLAEGFRVSASDDVSYDDRASRCRTEYIEHLHSRRSTDAKLAGKIVIDCANGAASSFAGAVFDGAADQIVVINAEPNGRNINLNCGSLHLGSLSQKVVEERAAMGIAFDGDADRALFVDSEGQIIDGDATLWIIANELKRFDQLRSKTVVATVMSNVGLELALNNIDVELVRAAVGDKYVLEKLIETDSEIGGEQSGHIIFPSSSLVGDGMATAILLINAISHGGGSLADAVSGFEKLPQVLVNVEVASKPEFESIEQIRDAVVSVRDQLEGNGRLLLRYSGTENLARVMIEGRDQDEIESLANGLAEEIKRAIG